MINPLSPHDASKHHFTSMKTNLFFFRPEVLKRKCLFSAETILTIHDNFLSNLNQINNPMAEGGPVCIFRSPKFLLKFA